jgi:hypothetical protein
MPLPDQPVTLAPEQIAELNRKLSVMRHDVNNTLAKIVAAVELWRLKPETVERMITTASEEPHKATELLAKFSADFEKAVGITRP